MPKHTVKKVNFSLFSLNTQTFFFLLFIYSVKITGFNGIISVNMGYFLCISHLKSIHINAR